MLSVDWMDKALHKHISKYLLLTPSNDYTMTQTVYIMLSSTQRPYNPTQLQTLNYPPTRVKVCASKKKYIARVTATIYQEYRATEKRHQNSKNSYDDLNPTRVKLVLACFGNRT